MEVVAAAASVAGILSLVGESLDGTRKLRDFFSDVLSAPTTVSSCLRDIDSLRQVIQSIKDLVEKLPPDFTNEPVVMVAIQIQLKDCTADVSHWLKTAKALRPASDAGKKSWMKKLWVALNIKSVNEIRRELERHRQALTLSLSILGR